eukprot:CAMPEP_0115086094 /NCGR_PEP_ID=MMETSP0227-20121206/22358_1 /TAXON_ID=89957 /ORGANISM="Polarella glacialis, Strain CCMP 1383" /LENGTH=665 /DNA_ID=CAMNT_0002475441 /DNA_START=249 /DNA_END=2246 /DNA_ORIENTATION=+
MAPQPPSVSLSLAAAQASAGDQQEPRPSTNRASQVVKCSGRPGLTYEAIRKLGEGAFGVAHLVRDRHTGQLRVLKTINKRRSQVPPAQLEREIRNMKACDHPHIVRLYEYYEDYENIYLIMERAAGGELHQVLQEQRRKNLELPERWVATVTRQCLQAIQYVHSMGIIHKDLKSENIMLLRECDVDDPKSQPHAVIIDLGIADVFNARLGRRARSCVVAGTPTHMAPEVWRGNFGPVADVWSLGVVLFELLSGEVPFLCSSLNSANEWVRLHQEGPKWSLLGHGSSQARAVCQRMLSCDERMRPTAQQCLGHSWFKEPEAQDVAGGAGNSQVEYAIALPAGSVAAPLAMPRLETPLAEYADHEKTVMLEVASKMHTGQVACVAEAFLSADPDRLGLVGIGELVDQLEVLGAERRDAEVYARCLDPDINGLVDYTELAAGCIALLYDGLRGMLWQSFCEIDVEGNGVLSPEEVRSVCLRLDLAGHGFPGGEGAADALDEALSRFSLDDRGLISFDELCIQFLPVRPSLPVASSSRPDQTINDWNFQALNAPLHDDEFEQLLDTIEASASADGPDSARASPMLGSAFRMAPPAAQGGSIRCDSGLSQFLAATPEPDAIEMLVASGAMGNPGSPTAAALASLGMNEAHASQCLDEELSHLLAEMSSTG